MKFVSHTLKTLKLKQVVNESVASAARAASEAANAALRNEIQVAKAQRAEVDAMFSETKVCFVCLGNALS